MGWNRTAFVADVDDIGSFGDFFDGPTALDRDETTGSDEATRRLANRFKFGAESLFITPFGTWWVNQQKH